MLRKAKVWKGVSDLLYPPRCVLCSAGGVEPFCAACEEGIEWVGEEVCRRCGASRLGGRCDECRGRDYGFSGAVAVGHYVGSLRKLILRFKLSGEAHLARELGRRLAQRVLDGGLPVDVVVPVPMRLWARMRRGYNPAEELARCVAKHLERPFVKALRKIRATPPQASLPMRERERNPVGAFRVARPERIRGRSVLLVDDVLTTGATATSCAVALREAGAGEVTVGVVGR